MTGQISRRKLIAGASAGVGVTALNGISGPATLARQDSTTFVYAARLETSTLDPNFNDGSYFRIPSASMYEALFTHVTDADGTTSIEPVLATDWEVSEDGLSYDIALRAGVKFHDGSDFDAESVKWTFERLLEQDTPVLTRLPSLDGVEVVDSNHVRFLLKNPDASFLAGLTRVLIISISAADHDTDGDMGKAWLDSNSVGTGPYTLDEWVRNQQISVVRFPDYWQGWDGNHLERVVVRIVKEPATHRQLLETGDAQMVNGLAFDDIDAMEDNPGVTVRLEPVAGMLNIGMHTQKPPFDNVDARRAVAHTFDYDGFIQGVLRGRARQPLGPIPYGSWALDESLEPPRRDVELAKELAEKGGITPGTKARIVTISPFGWYQLRQAQILQQNLEEIGIEATIDDKPDSAAFVAELSDKENGPNFFFYQSLAVMDDPDADLRRLYHSSSVGGAGRNGMWYQDEAFDGLLDGALELQDQEDRIEAYRQIQEKLIDDMPVFWPATLDEVIAFRDSVEGFVWNPYDQGVPNFYALSLSE